MEELRTILSSKSVSSCQNATAAGECSVLAGVGFALCNTDDHVLLVLRYLGNIASQPEEPKFQRIRANNRFFVANITILGEPVASNLMHWSGFVVDPATERTADKYFIFKPQGDKVATAAGVAEQAQRRSACLELFQSE